VVHSHYVVEVVAVVVPEERDFLISMHEVVDLVVMVVVVVLGERNFLIWMHEVVDVVVMVVVEELDAI
jgi:hypothetical protein